MFKKTICSFVFCFALSTSLYAKSNIEPTWVKYPYKACQKNQLCATGNGETLNLAKADARNNVLKYFQTNIRSEFSSSITSDEKEVKELNSDKIFESTNGVLKATEIQETYSDKNGFYAFAVLNKDILAKELTSDINKLDSKMQLLLSEKEAKYTKQLKKLYQERSDLNKQYLFLTGNSIPEVVKYEDIYQNKKISSNIKYYIETTTNDLSNSINYLKSIILSNNFKLTNSKNNADKTIIFKIVKEDMYINVDGFKKQKYTLTMNFFDKNGVEKNTITEEFVDTGRNEKQIKDSINSQVKKYFEEHLEEIL